MLSNRKRREMSKTEAEIKELFTPYVREDEEFRWVGQPKRNWWHIKAQQIPELGCAVLLYSLLVMTFGMGLFLFVTILLSGEFALALLVCLMVFSMFFIALTGRSRKGYDPNHIFQLSYFAITNQRIILFEQSIIRDYSLMLTVDAVIGKPKNGASTIYLYNKTNPTGQLPEPLFQLKGIAEEEAQSAYEILRQAREEALENRARAMGIE